MNLVQAYELVAKRVNDECYYFPEKFSADHKCKSKGVFFLVLDDGAETEAMADELGISLHALIGIDVVDTMKLHIQISDQCWWCSWTQAPPTPSSRKRWCPTSAFG
jgi:hypothetical protein